MPIRTNWGIIAFAGAIALLAIGVAFTTAHFESTKNETPLVATTTADSLTSGDWQTVLAKIATSSIDASGKYTAPKELSPTEAVSREIFTTYASLKESGASSANIQKAIDTVVLENAKKSAPSMVYTTGNIVVSDSATIPNYTGALVAVLNRSSVVQEYELTTFSRTIGQNLTTGTPTLQTAAAVYRGIAKDIALIPVPRTLAAQHLSVLQSISNLADATEHMSTWSGDPIMALVYADAFTKADAATQSSVNNLFSALAKAAKKS